MKALMLAVALVLAAPISGLVLDDGTATAEAATVKGSKQSPPSPRLPRNFHGKGRYVVADLDVSVPFTWVAKNGDMQMTAGGKNQPIWFSNIISDGVLYTVTYTWPGIARRPCSRIGPFTLADFNQGLESARFVGPEILQDQNRHVNHFRAGLVYEPPADVIPKVDGLQLRFPVMAGDFYVDQKDSTKFWQVLHSGLQNLYDRELDEWIVMDTFARGAGKVTLPAECSAQPDTTPTTTVPAS
jgi:hypothetical protein